MNKFDKSTSAVFSLNYHFITVVKYRRKVFTNDDIINSVKTIFEQISEKHDVKIIEQECDDDHIHLLFRAKPTLNFKSYIQALKGRSARLLRAQYLDLLKDKLWVNISGVIHIFSLLLEM